MAAFLYIGPSPSSDGSLQTCAQCIVFKTSKSFALENAYGADAFIQPKAVQCRTGTIPALKEFPVSLGPCKIERAIRNPRQHTGRVK